MHKTADFHSNLLISSELVAEGYQERPEKCVHFKLKCVHFTHFIERPLPGMVILVVSLQIVFLNYDWHKIKFQTQYERISIAPYL